MITYLIFCFLRVKVWKCDACVIFIAQPSTQVRESKKDKKIAKLSSMHWKLFEIVNNK